ncbi:RNA-directed DNA polymerase, eukaryota, reverse transcriptase zinc-binding domain protein [Tanacetum coccineum]
MEVFNMIMIKNVNEAAHFKYHYGCSNLKLTHMCFADDLLVLCNGDIESLRVVKKSLDEFSRVSGLYPNLSKSTIVFGNVPNNEKVDMLQILSFKCGKLPMKYLGVPLLAKRLGVKDCAIENGPLDRFISNRDIYDARLTNEACLADVIRNGNWIWPAEWESDFTELNQIIIPNLTQRNDAVNWYHVVWFSQCNPKQAFILWMEIQGKLLTQDRMAWAQGNDLMAWSGDMT